MDIFKEIIDWSAGLPTWQQEAVRLLLANGEITVTDIDDLVRRVKTSDDGSVKVAIPSPQPMGTRAVALRKLEHICGVNALAEGQVLKFEGPTGLTVIYGENGSGKSGYSRILKHACRSREKKPDPIQGDVYRQGVCPTPKARITFLDGTRECSEDWSPGCSTSEALRSVALFDSSCSRLYVEKDGDLAFQPWGLEVFKQLADAAIAVKEALAKEASAIAVPSFPSLAHPTVQDAVNGVLAKNNPTTRAKVEKLAALSDRETKRADTLQTQIAQLESSNPKKLAEGCRRLAARLEVVAQNIGTANTRVAQQLKLAPETAKQRAATAKLAAKASERTFKMEPVQGVGTDPWKKMFEYAQEFSVGVAYPEEDFPYLDDDAHCVLCQQPLGDAAKDRMTRFAEFVGNRAEADAKAALAAYTTVRTTIIDAAKGIVAIDDALVEQVGGHSEKAEAELRTARTAYATFLAAAETAETVAAWKKLIAPTPAAQLLMKLVAKLRTDAGDYERNSNEAEQNLLKQELNLLRQRQQLAKQKGAILDAAKLTARWRRLSTLANGINTRRITTKEGEIAEQVLTRELGQTLNAELQALGAEDLTVEYVRKGRAGQSRHYLKLSRAPDGTNVEDILSEGEHRCLGLAAFLTELNLAGHTSGIVLDDPVSSLDHRHRDALATRLVDEAKRRQVVVFTHDLPFLHALNRAAAKSRLPVLGQAVAYFTEGAGVIANQQYPDAMTAKKYVAHIKAKADEVLALDSRDAARRARIADLYTEIRNAWERVVGEVLLCGVVSAFDKAVHTKQLKGVYVDDDIYHKVYYAYEEANNVTRAHRAPAASGPSPTRTNAQIKADVEQLVQFRKDCETKARRLADQRRELERAPSGK